MKAYFYTPEDLGVSSFHPGHLRLEGFDITENPANADVFALGPIMHNFSKEKLLNLKYLANNEERHVVWDLADDFRTFGVPWIAIRCACTRHILEADPTTIPWPWPVDPLTELQYYKDTVESWPRNFTYDVVFQGWRSPLSFTDRACASVLHTPLRSYISKNPSFYGHMPETVAKKRLHERFIASLYQGRLQLVPTSIRGVIRYRLLEQMSLGRGLPVHINDDVVMPWQSKIDWPRCVITISEAEVDDIGNYLVTWFRHHDDAEILSRSRYAQEMYNTWLHRDKWDSLFATAVTERLEGRL